LEISLKQFSVLVTEYFTSIFDPYTCSANLLGEACGMLFSLIKILKIANVDIITTLSPYLAEILKHTLRDVDIEITSKEKYFEQIDMLKNYVDYVIAIAPPIQLQTISEIVNQKLLGPPPTLIKSLSNKYEALNILKKYGIDTPTTIICCKDMCEYRVEDLMIPVVVKPAMLTGAECVYVVNDKNNVREYVEKVMECDPTHCVVIQEYIPGYHGSISVVLDHGEVLLVSLNLQLISIKNSSVKYHGNILPLRDKASVRKALDIADKLRYLNELNGYIGLDVVWNEKMYVVEVNPRFTTSGIGIVEVYPVLGAIFLKKIKPKKRYLAEEVLGYAYVVKRLRTPSSFYDICLNGLAYGYTESFTKVLEILKQANPNALEGLLYNINTIA
jgi:predicted ATP-grasp superfamily ATP-dependent carboligase